MGKEISRGTGEFLETLARLGGCANASAMGSFLQSEYQSIFPSAKVSDKQVGMTIVTMLKDNDHCGARLFTQRVRRPLIERPDTSPRGVGLPPPPRLCS